MVKLTVLMPVYNAERYLNEAIESILNQTFRDYEFLIIDDGSTDRSVDIVRSYNDQRIRLVVNEKNMGISRTLNKGIELSETEIIARMDADDISLKNRLEIQYFYLEKHPEISMVSSNVERINEYGESLGNYNPYPKFFYFNLLFHCFGIYHPTVMYRKQAVREVGMYPETLSEDYRLWSKLIRKYPFHYSRDILLKYRITDQSISHNILKEEYRDDEKRYAFENLNYYLGKDYSLPDMWYEVYRFNFEPILKDGNLREMICCILEIDYIKNRLLTKDNINRVDQDIIHAANNKKKRITEVFLRHLSIRHGIRLLLETGNYKRLAAFSTKGTLRRLFSGDKKLYKNREVLS